MRPDITTVNKYDPRILILNLPEPINIIKIKELDHRISRFYFGNYWIDIDTLLSCCEIYELFLNGYKYNGETCFKINTSDQVTFTFDEKYYRKGEMVKNSMLIKFSGGDRIKSNRNQVCGRTYQHIYTRSHFLEWNANFNSDAEPDVDADADIEQKYQHIIDKVIKQGETYYYFLGTA